MYDNGISAQEIKAGKINSITWTGIAADSILMILKLFAGIAGTSVAMIAGATHTFSDLAADIVTLLGFNAPRVSSVKGSASARGEFETLIAISIGIAVLYAGIQIFLVGVGNVHNSYDGKLLREPGWIAFYASIFSILIKEWLYRFTVKKSMEIECPEIISKARSHRADVFSSIVSMFGIGGAIILGGKWRLLDPLASVIISLFIFKAAIDIIKTGIGEFGRIYDGRKKKIKCKKISYLSGKTLKQFFKPNIFLPYTIKKLNIDLFCDFSLLIQRKVTKRKDARSENSDPFAKNFSGKSLNSTGKPVSNSKDFYQKHL